MPNMTYATKRGLRVSQKGFGAMSYLSRFISKYFVTYIVWVCYKGFVPNSERNTLQDSTKSPPIPRDGNIDEYSCLVLCPTRFHNMAEKRIKDATFVFWS